MLNLDNITNKNNKEHNKKRLFIPDHLDKILIIGGSGSGKTNALLNLIGQQDDIDKIYLDGKDLSEPKYEFLIKKIEDAGINNLNDLNEFMSVQILWMTFIRILVITTQTDKKNLNSV